jgi:hypothetical protein
MHASVWLRILIDAQLSGRHRNHPGTLESQAARLSNLLGELAASRCLPPRGSLSVLRTRVPRLTRVIRVLLMTPEIHLLAGVNARSVLLMRDTPGSQASGSPVQPG